MVVAFMEPCASLMSSKLAAFRTENVFCFVAPPDMADIF